MSEAYVLTLAQDAIYLALMLAGPALLASLLIGSLISIVQAATQINEVTLTFVPKMIGIILILIILGSWMLQKIVAFTAALFNNLPNLVH
ncbi:MAG: flagellar biosynthesis protein FliQ [Anaerolineaceae bacterium]|jgi:flagellar biosynthetic protein FliQ